MLHTIIAYVEDKPGVLNRVASLFRRRAFNIESLAVGHTHLPGVSRMTIIVEAAEEGTARRIEANLYKLVNVGSCFGLYQECSDVELGLSLCNNRYA